MIPSTSTLAALGVCAFFLMGLVAMYPLGNPETCSLLQVHTHHHPFYLHETIYYHARSQQTLLVVTTYRGDFPPHTVPCGVNLLGEVVHWTHEFDVVFWLAFWFIFSLGGCASLPLFKGEPKPHIV